MDTIKINKKNVLMIAHRGASSIERENTNGAFLIAGSRSYYGIETDVHVTKDGKFIICHDDNIKRVTGIDMIIEESEYDELLKNKILDFDLTTRNDLVFPSLDDYLNICIKYEKQAILEIKNEVCKEKALEIVDKIIEKGWFEKTTIISFYAQNLINIKEKYRDADVQFLTGEFNEEVLNMLLRYQMGLDIYYESVNKEIIDKLHSYGLKVNCWTVNIPTIAEKLINMGVDMITSDTLE